MSYSYDQRTAAEKFSPVQMAYLKALGEQLASMGSASIEYGVANTGKRNVIQALLNRDLLELDQKKSGYSSTTNKHDLFYKLTPKGEKVIEELFGLRRR